MTYFRDIFVHRTPRKGRFAAPNAIYEQIIAENIWTWGCSSALYNEPNHVLLCQYPPLLYMRFRKRLTLGSLDPWDMQDLRQSYHILDLT